MPYIHSPTYNNEEFVWVEVTKVLQPVTRLCSKLLLHSGTSQSSLATRITSKQFSDTCTVSEEFYDSDTDSVQSFDTTPAPDIITRLPAELQLNIIFSMRSKEDLDRLSIAIPAIDNLRATFSEAIERHFVAIDLPGDLLQDALAIKRFPSIETSTMREIEEHLDRWGHQAFPDPFETQDRATIRALATLVAKVEQFIEDYISKATSRELYKAIFMLPMWAHPSHQSEIDQIDHYLPLESLYASERSRLMRAFLRHEILCKVHQPRAYPRRADIIVDYSARMVWDRYWKNWDRLSGFTAMDAGLKIRGEGSKFEIYRDIVMIQSVYQYVQGMYGALSDRISQPGWFSAPVHLAASLTYDCKYQATLSDKRAAQELSRNKVLPAELHIERDVLFRSKWHPSWHFLQPATYDAALIAFGLDLLDHLLTISQAECETLLNNLFHEVMPNDPKGVEMHPIGPSRPLQTYESYHLHPPTQWNTRREERQRRIMAICRHRAWGLFEDGRLYPEFFNYARIYLDQDCEQEFWKFWDASGRSRFAEDAKSVQPLVTELPGGSRIFPSMHKVKPFWLNERVCFRGR